MKKLKVLVVFGTRPEAIKMAPLIRELKYHSAQIITRVAVSAQHREMLDQVLEFFDLKPDYDLNVMKPGQSLDEITRQVLSGIGDVCDREKPDLVLVHGDTTTTMTASLAAFYRQVTVGHVEAGLRTGNKYRPYPEEMNRRLTGCLADLHFAPTMQSRANLLAEGVPEGRVFVTGNTVIDALLATVREEYEFDRPELTGLDPENRLLLVTTHRRESFGEPLRQVYLALNQILEEFPDLQVVFPVHKNPQVRQAVNEVLKDNGRLHLIEPLDYVSFINLMNRADLILTDSGGLQEEAPALGKPVLVLRDNTERPEGVEAGTVKLVGTDAKRIIKEARVLLSDAGAYRRMANAVNPFGDGQAAARIVQAILYYAGFITKKPLPFLTTRKNSKN